MIRLKNEEEIKRIRESCLLVYETLIALKKMIVEGIPTVELDAFARSHIEGHGGKPAFLGYLNYPASLCVSINNEVIHGIPGTRKLRKGDIVSLDIGVNLGGYFGDAAITIPVGEIIERRRRLIAVTEECLARGIAAAAPGNRIGDISRAIFGFASANGFGVVHEYCGHGVGFAPHEEPQVPNYIGSGANHRLKPGMVIAIEPMINEGTGDVILLDDGWTVATADGLDAAHFEHTVAILADRVAVLTAPAEIAVG